MEEEQKVDLEDRRRIRSRRCAVFYRDLALSTIHFRNSVQNRSARQCSDQFSRNGPPADMHIQTQIDSERLRTVFYWAYAGPVSTESTLHR